MQIRKCLPQWQCSLLQTNRSKVNFNWLLLFWKFWQLEYLCKKLFLRYSSIFKLLNSWLFGTVKPLHLGNLFTRFKDFHRTGGGRIFKKIFPPLSLMKTCRMSLSSAGSISLDSTFKEQIICRRPWGCFCLCCCCWHLALSAYLLLASLLLIAVMLLVDFLLFLVFLLLLVSLLIGDIPANCWLPC